MSWTSRIRLRVPAGALLLTLMCCQVNAQWMSGSLSDSTNQADYIVVTTAEYISPILRLAAQRVGAQSLSVTIVLLDSITAQFPRTTPDSSLRDFVTRTLTHWRVPRPQFLLLAGNVNVVPSHREASPLAPYANEDSVMIDQWFVSQLSGSEQQQRPGMAVGRFPAWSPGELSQMIAKTLAYEQAPASRWASRSIALADSGDFGIFEGDAGTVQQFAARRWQDTVTIHIRPGSPFYRRRRQFFDLWNEGSAFVTFVGHMNGSQFSFGAYFTLNDIDSLNSGSAKSVYILGGAQRFEQPDSVPIAVALMQAAGAGAVCVCAPSGLMYESQNADFGRELFAYLAAHPSEPIGTAWLSVKQRVIDNRITLFGDPALVVKSSTLASIPNPKDGTPSGYVLCQNFPNPFNPKTVVKYQLPVVSDVRLVVYDLLGREVAVLVNEKKEAGTYTVDFNGSGLASGVYVYRLQAGNFMQSRKLLLVR